MCWITREKWRTRPRVAKKRIEVWKIYESMDADNHDLRSIVANFWIFPNMRYKILETKMDNPTEIPYKYIWNARINNGFHSYKKGAVKIACREIFSAKQGKFWTNVLIVKDNIVSYIKIADFHRIVVRCYIPIGATYYLNESGEYVSNKIIVEDIIDYDKLDKLD